MPPDIWTISTASGSRLGQIKATSLSDPSHVDCFIHSQPQMPVRVSPSLWQAALSLSLSGSDLLDPHHVRVPVSISCRLLHSHWEPQTLARVSPSLSQAALCLSLSLALIYWIHTTSGSPLSLSVSESGSDLLDTEHIRVTSVSVIPNRIRFSLNANPCTLLIPYNW